MLLVSLWWLHQAGATVMSQVIRGLVAFLPLSIGFLLFSAANNLKGERVYLYLFWGTFIAGAILFLLLFIHGGRPHFVIKHAVSDIWPAPCVSAAG